MLQRLSMCALAVLALGVAIHDRPPAPLQPAAPRIVTIPSAPSCGHCRIVLRRVVTLGAADDSVSLTPRARVVADRQGRYYAAPTYTPGALAVYDRRGRLIRTFGRRGGGPGEFEGSFAKLAVGPGDSVHVVEGTRHSVVAPGATRVVRSSRLPIAPYYIAALPNGLLAVQYPVAGVGGVNQPVHVLDRGGELARSFGGDGRPLDHADIWGRVRAIAASRDGGVWIARTNEYRVERWSAGGVRRITLVRDADWFRPWTGYDGREPLRRPPRPLVDQLAEDPAGRLWVITVVADAKWEPWPQARGEGPPLDSVAWNRVWDTVLEVIDPSSGRVLARTRFDAQAIGFVGDGRMLYTRRTDDDGFHLIDVWRVDLDTAGTRRKR